MAGIMFDTLKLARQLEAAGMSPEQATGTAAALAENLTGTVATKADVEASELRLRGEIATVRADLSGLETRLLRMMVTQTWAIIGATAAIVAVIVGLAKLFH
jgi:hypothetical protein